MISFPSFSSVHLQGRCFQIRSHPETPGGHEFWGTPFNPPQPPKVSCAQLPILSFKGYPWLLGFWHSMNQPSLWLHKLQDSWHSGKESTCLCRRCGFDPWVRKIPWRRKWQLSPVFLSGKPIDMVPFLSPGYLSDPGIEPTSPALASRFFILSHQGISSVALLLTKVQFF